MPNPPETYSGVSEHPGIPATLKTFATLPRLAEPFELKTAKSESVHFSACGARIQTPAYAPLPRTAPIYCLSRWYKNTSDIQRVIGKKKAGWA